jgi:hypothetical protein
MPRRDCTKAIIAIPLLNVVLMFCSIYTMFNGVDFIFLSAYLMFLVVVLCIFKGVSCFHT